MKMSQADYDERKHRQNNGVASDDDRRLIKQYEAEGYVQSRLKREERAKAAAGRALEDLVEAELVELAGDGDEDGEQPTVTQRDSHGDWITFAEAVNSQLAEDERPIAEPAKATKKALVAAYKNYAT